MKTTLLSLQEVSQAMAATQKRLATGLRVIDPSDNPAAHFSESGLNSRAAKLNTLLDLIGGAQKTFDAAVKGIKAVEGLLQSAQSVASQALASANTLVKVTATNSSALTTASVIATTSGSSTRLRAGDTVTVSDGTTTATYTAANSDTVQSFLNAINNTSNLKATASLNSAGQIQIQATGTNNITIGGTTTGSGTLTSVLGLTAATTTFTANPTRTSLAQQFDSLRTQIDQVIQDASYNGVNLLNGDSLSVNFNESGASKLTVTGTAFSSNGLGVAAVSTGTGGQFQTDAEISSAMSSIATALTTVRTQTSTFGANNTILQTRQDFTKSLIDTLQSGADQLVAADMNEESALMLALQTRQQIAQTSLSLAGQAQQQALRLFSF